MNPIIEKIHDEQFIAVLRAGTVEEAIEKGEELIQAGIRILEVTFTIPEAEKVIEYFTSKVDMIVGAGTVITTEQAQLAVRAGAQFVISPGYDHELGMFAKEHHIVYIPGVVTPTDIMQTMKDGFTILKLFPANAYSPSYMKHLKGPFPNIELIPTGGITNETAQQWLDAGALAVGMGSALAAIKGPIL
ncbi:bifunctional 4-hydroxy-2-oxoglutarate aldolase/2-dehydro-3-deoxy-phosphogluconate aldolase [Heyndrickxia ginsengihumi]|uniref:bifunctional 4-hydroxy-2-oxoglutarate aldolase/2-dehydro-3-deoxy-phosphogluconate aldolase n=1 Tax=Heyndrickxia ginsengihumi TaxID=363870 RepID=UPI0004B9B27D|nr:bifunctional 4-hydroxy-2-oxoglutarate aldolase/2-dehydro-3-deoxy-phosphogluconate aldolase [Heyndrickxia ginsengihumi]